MLDSLIRHPFMSADGLAACTAAAFVDAMCRFEIGLARVQERAGILPAGTADTIAAALRVGAFDLGALAAQAPDGGNVAIPFVRQARALLPEPARGWLHHGATSQDVVDTALMLVLEPRLARCLDRLACCRAAELALMSEHTATPMIGRTLMQQALPITFGAKVAHWAVGLARAERRLADVVADALFVQFGGPVGMHTGLGEQGPALMDALADELGLARPVLPWHTDRQPVLVLVDALGAVAAAAEKIALDVALMAQSEIGELGEPAATGAGGSSSMPHKRNPVGCARIRAAARAVHAQVGLVHAAAAQPQERGLGEWHAEWAPLVDAALYVEGALDTLTTLLDGLEVHPQTMYRNLTPSLIPAAIDWLSDSIDREQAATLVNTAAQTAACERRHLADVLCEAAPIGDTVDAEALRRALDPLARTGASDQHITRVRAVLETMPAPRDRA